MIWSAFYDLYVCIFFGMNVVKYLCEFFFCNFWHYLELCLMLVLLCPWNCITINKPDGEKEEGGRK